MSSNAIISELLLIRASVADERFVALRRIAATEGGAREQYFGEEKALSTYRPAKEGVKQPLVWVIQWPKVLPEGFDEKAFHAKVKALDEDGAPEVFRTAFEDAALPRPALTAPLTEFATLVVQPSSVGNQDTAKSLEKTFTDCFDAPDGGFTGGFWGPSESSNPAHDKLYSYYLGWETKELHSKYSKSDLFALELDNLASVTKDGWAIWATLEQANEV
ncbi:hypothetical protein CYLTODRAFT_458664 [Cylindrobasidium torrendii FP15055 ss-10]|uniref:ABM domain-containing protein n=1 Tax=Cylindrobasidium torrendii FP15055 ss-10 TaxID=1314674 RepID=A0A0D7AXX5_9AGAR|nr:hypothetical protein CYLTODRAFT_458664 [Cylindrobasidium torrendii FP15055 ss-10]